MTTKNPIKTKKLCIDARMIFCSGIGTYLQNVLSGLKKQKHFNCKVALLVSPQDADDQRLKDYDKIICSAPIYSVQEQLVLPFLIPSSDLFWSPHYNVPFFPIRAKKKLVTIHDVYHLSIFSKLKLKEKIYVKTVFSRAFKKSDRIITPSTFSLSEMVCHFPKTVEKIEVIHNGVDFKKFSETQTIEKLTAIKNKYHLPRKFFLYVGNIKPHKNLQGLLQAFKVFSKDLSLNNYGLILIGQMQGLRRPALISQLIDSQSNIKLLENVTDSELTAFYTLAKALVLPSFYEGFGLPALEAMAGGCPVIAAKSSSLPEVCGEAAYYIDPHDIQSIALAMKKLAGDGVLRDTLRTKGFERVQKFTWAASIKKHLQVIEELLN